MMSNQLAGAHDPGLAFEQEWVHGLRAETTAAAEPIEPTGQPRPAWHAPTVNPDWRRRPVWEPLPLWDPGPEPLTRKTKHSRSRSGDLGAKQPMVYDTRGRPRPAVGTGMKDLRVQLAAVATEVVNQATDAQEASAANAELSKRVSDVRHNVEVNTVQGVAAIQALSKDLAQLEDQRTALEARQQARVDTQQRFDDAILEQATAADALVAVQASERAAELQLQEQQSAARVLEANALALAQLQRAATEAALETADLVVSGSVAQEQAALVLWFQGSRGRRHAFGLLRLAVQRSRQRNNFTKRAVFRRTVELLCRVLAAWRHASGRSALARRAIQWHHTRAVGAALSAWREYTTFEQNLRARVASVGAACDARRLQRAVRLWAEVAARRQRRRQLTGRRVALACAMERWKDASERAELDHRAHVMAMAHWLRTLLRRWRSFSVHQAAACSQLARRAMVTRAWLAADACFQGWAQTTRGEQMARRWACRRYLHTWSALIDPLSAHQRSKEAPNWWARRRMSRSLIVFQELIHNRRSARRRAAIVLASAQRRGLSSFESLASNPSVLAEKSFLKSHFQRRLLWAWHLMAQQSALTSRRAANLHQTHCFATLKACLASWRAVVLLTRPARLQWQKWAYRRVLAALASHAGTALRVTVLAPNSSSSSPSSSAWRRRFPSLAAGALGPTSGSVRHPRALMLSSGLPLEKEHTSTIEAPAQATDRHPEASAITAARIAPLPHAAPTPRPLATSVTTTTAEVAPDELLMSRLRPLKLKNALRHWAETAHSSRRLSQVADVVVRRQRRSLARRSIHMWTLAVMRKAATSRGAGVQSVAKVVDRLEAAAAKLESLHKGGERLSERRSALQDQHRALTTFTQEREASDRAAQEIAIAHQEKAANLAREIVKVARQGMEAEAARKSLLEATSRLRADEAALAAREDQQRAQAAALAAVSAQRRAAELAEARKRALAAQQKAEAAEAALQRAKAHDDALLKEANDACTRSAAELSRRSEALDTLKRDLSDAHHQLHNVKAQTRQKEEDSQATTQAASALRAALSEAHVLKRAAEEQDARVLALSRRVASEEASLRQLLQQVHPPSQSQARGFDLEAYLSSLQSPPPPLGHDDVNLPFHDAPPHWLTEELRHDRKGGDTRDISSSSSTDNTCDITAAAVHAGLEPPLYDYHPPAAASSSDTRRRPPLQSKHHPKPMHSAAPSQQVPPQRPLLPRPKVAPSAPAPLSHAPPSDVPSACALGAPVPPPHVPRVPVPASLAVPHEAPHITWETNSGTAPEERCQKSDFPTRISTSARESGTGAGDAAAAAPSTLKPPPRVWAGAWVGGASHHHHQNHQNNQQHQHQRDHQHQQQSAATTATAAAPASSQPSIDPPKASVSADQEASARSEPSQMGPSAVALAARTARAAALMADMALHGSIDTGSGSSRSVSRASSTQRSSSTRSRGQRDSSSSSRSNGYYDRASTQGSSAGERSNSRSSGSSMCSQPLYPAQRGVADALESPPLLPGPPGIRAFRPIDSASVSHHNNPTPEPPAASTAAEQPCDGLESDIQAVEARLMGRLKRST